MAVNKIILNYVYVEYFCGICCNSVLYNEKLYGKRGNDMDSKELKIEQIRENGILVCKLSGWLDPNTSPELMDKVSLGGVKQLIFDMSDVEYVFSAGLRVMLIFQRMMESEGGQMKLINVPDSIRFIFEDTGLESMLE